MGERPVGVASEGDMEGTGMKPDRERELDASGKAFGMEVLNGDFGAAAGRGGEDEEAEAEAASLGTRGRRKQSRQGKWGGERLPARFNRFIGRSGIWKWHVMVRRMKRAPKL